MLRGYPKCNNEKPLRGISTKGDHLACALQRDLSLIEKAERQLENGDIEE